MQDLSSKDPIVRLINTTHGRDKTFRFLQYFTKFIHYFLYSRSTDSSLIKIHKSM